MQINSNIFKHKNGQSYLYPFIIISSLFFLWGLAHSILDVLNKHFQDSFTINKTQSALVQTMVYGGYFLMALPAGKIISKWGYRVGILTGLVLYGIGTWLFIPSEWLNSFPFFLFSLFIIGCGLTCLETAANPYVTVLGNEEGKERRINMAQSLNGLGWIIGPLLGGIFVFSTTGEKGSVVIPYTIIGTLVFLVALLFSRIKLPEITDTKAHFSNTTKQNIFSNRNFTFGIIALFAYVAAQTGINSFFINYIVESNLGLDSRTAAILLSFGGMGLFMVGRLLGSWLMSFIKPLQLLNIVSIGALVTMLLVILNFNQLSGIALFICYLFESIMFPTIFSLALTGAKGQTKLGSSILIMSIVGGAISPVIMGLIADHTGSMTLAFIIPLICFIIIYIYSITYKK